MINHYTDGFVKDCSNSIANALELQPSHRYKAKEKWKILREDGYMSIFMYVYRCVCVNEWKCESIIVCQ